MSRSELLQKIIAEQREEAMKLTPGERIQMACELSDTCVLLNQAARKALEEKRVIAKT